jgi:GH24 family phage-related lysozyme (muramidase)
MKSFKKNINTLLWKQETINRIKKNENIILDENVFNNNFLKAIEDANKLADFEINSNVFGVIVEMCFILGRLKVSKFFKFFSALRSYNYPKAADEILLTNLFKENPKLCKELSNIIKECK